MLSRDFARTVTERLVRSDAHDQWRIWFVIGHKMFQVTILIAGIVDDFIIGKPNKVLLWTLNIKD